MGLRIEEWVAVDGTIPIEEWLSICSQEHRKMTTSMLACLEISGMRCHFVKDLKLHGLCELKTKSGNIRVYFFVDGDIAVIVGAGEKKTQKLDLILSYERMKEYEYSKKARK